MLGVSAFADRAGCPSSLYFLWKLNFVDIGVFSSQTYLCTFLWVKIYQGIDKSCSKIWKRKSPINKATHFFFFPFSLFQPNTVKYGLWLFLIWMSKSITSLLYTMIRVTFLYILSPFQVTPIQNETNEILCSSANTGAFWDCGPSSFLSKTHWNSSAWHCFTF